MYRHHKILACILFFAVLAVSYEVKLALTNNLIGYLITFFSIVFGFYMTGLAILFGSSFSKRLRQEEDSRIKTQTKLHTLKIYFNYSSFTSLTAIVSLLIMSLIGMTVADGQKKIVNDECLALWGSSLCGDQLLTSVILGLAAINIMFMWLLLRVFFNGFLEEGGRHE